MAAAKLMSSIQNEQQHIAQLAQGHAKQGATLKATSNQRNHGPKTPFKRDDDALIERYNHDPPSLILHLYSTYFKFEHEDGFFSYKSQFKDFLTCVKEKQLPADLMDIFNEASCRYYEGCLIVEIKDHRQSSKTGQENEEPDASSNDTTGPSVKRVVMRPTAESIWSDIQLLNESWGYPWTEQMALEVEAQILLATEEPLCLDPSFNVTRISNALAHSSQPRKTKKKQKWNSLEREQKLAKKAENNKLMTLMDMRAKRSFPFEPSFGNISFVQDWRTKRTKFSHDPIASIEMKRNKNRKSLTEPPLLPDGRKCVRTIRFQRNEGPDRKVYTIINLYFSNGVYDGVFRWGTSPDTSLHGGNIEFKVGPEYLMEIYVVQLKTTYGQFNELLCDYNMANPVPQSPSVAARLQAAQQQQMAMLQNAALQQQIQAARQQGKMLTPQQRALMAQAQAQAQARSQQPQATPVTPTSASTTQSQPPPTTSLPPTPSTAPAAATASPTSSAQPTPHLPTSSTMASPVQAAASSTAPTPIMAPSNIPASNAPVTNGVKPMPMVSQAHAQQAAYALQQQQMARTASNQSNPAAANGPVMPSNMMPMATSGVMPQQQQQPMSVQMMTAQRIQLLVSAGVLPVATAQEFIQQLSSNPNAAALIQQRLQQYQQQQAVLQFQQQQQALMNNQQRPPQPQASVAALQQQQNQQAMQGQQPQQPQQQAGQAWAQNPAQQPNAAAAQQQLAANQLFAHLNPQQQRQMAEFLLRRKQLSDLMSSGQINAEQFQLQFRQLQATYMPVLQQHQLHMQQRNAIALQQRALQQQATAATQPQALPAQPQQPPPTPQQQPQPSPATQPQAQSSSPSQPINGTLANQDQGQPSPQVPQTPSSQPQQLPQMTQQMIQQMTPEQQQFYQMMLLQQRLAAAARAKQGGAAAPMVPNGMVNGMAGQQAANGNPVSSNPAANGTPATPAMNSANDTVTSAASSPAMAGNMMASNTMPNGAPMTAQQMATMQRIQQNIMVQAALFRQQQMQQQQGGAPAMQQNQQQPQASPQRQQALNAQQQQLLAAQRNAFQAAQQPQQQPSQPGAAPQPQPQMQMNQQQFFQRLQLQILQQQQLIQREQANWTPQQLQAARFQLAYHQQQLSSFIRAATSQAGNPNLAAAAANTAPNSGGAN
ncbi:hypothetical protein DM01DRAFT_1304435 [Hesseltinella vesiculosa]|uniref:Spt20-like SEP domain-containing protein n=1 Tax=Hesseltinella vesiculosa TaxID=101127 RepID=A0A1X2GKF7_9FUNG|nr:hypothetical protein DM01DRAFT_1304435 [Hesseltinella vesiculosa]